MITQKTWSEADLRSLPRDGFIHEVVDGELVVSPKCCIADLFKEWDWE